MSGNLSIVLATVLLMADSAFAADLAPVPAPLPPEPTFTWSGFYIGVNGGYAFSSFAHSYNSLLGNSESGSGLVGATGGFNYMLAPHILASLEADFGYTGIGKQYRSSFTSAVTGHGIEDLATVRARAGYSIDRLLLFVSGGFALSNGIIDVAVPLTGYNRFVHPGIRPGWSAGAGAEYFITSNLSAKVEYIFASTNSDLSITIPIKSVNYNMQLNSAVNTSLVKAGLNFHF